MREVGCGHSPLVDARIGVIMKVRVTSVAGVVLLVEVYIMEWLPVFGKLPLVVTEHLDIVETTDADLVNILISIAL